MAKGIRITTIAAQRDFSVRDRAFERARELANAHIMFAMEWIGESDCQRAERLERELREECRKRQQCEIELAAARKPKRRTKKAK